jgi:FAD/FMN-containing dehydrogenase
MEVRTLDGGAVELDRNALQAGLRLPLLAPGSRIRRQRAPVERDDPQAAALVVRPHGAADVLHAVRFARERGLLISIKGGGHNIGGTAIADGGIVFELSRMKGVHVDPRARVARVQAGCLLGDVDRETAVHDLAAVLGFISETGVAGLTLGGGFGYLTRQHGYTVDNLVEVEIVTRTAGSGAPPATRTPISSGRSAAAVETSAS